jgi:hypothetical protein
MMKDNIPIMTAEKVIKDRLRLRKTFRNASLNIIPISAPPLFFPPGVGIDLTVFENDQPVCEIHHHSVMS